MTSPWSRHGTSTSRPSGPPVWLVHGGEDRVIPPSHAQRLLGDLASAELWLRPRDGHVSVLLAVPVAMDWLLAQHRGTGR